MSDLEKNAVTNGLWEALEEARIFHKELEGDNPRAAVVLGAAKIDAELAEIVRLQFPPISESMWKKLGGKGGRGPLGSYEAKADLVQAFGLIGHETRAALAVIGSVRNKFAHTTSIRDFNHPTIKNYCAKLANNPVYPYRLIEDPAPQNLRWYFMTVLKMLDERLEEIRWHYFVAQHGGNPNPYTPLP